MGSCLSIGAKHGKKSVDEEIFRLDERRPESSARCSRSNNANETAEKQVVVLNPSIWEHLPDDLTRLVLGKLPLSSVIHLRCVSKQWNSWILSSTIASPFSFNELVDWHVHPLIIFMYTLILVRDLDNQSPETQAALSGRSSLARFFHIKLRLEAHYADVFGWRPRVDQA